MDSKTYTIDELKQFDKETVIALLISMQEQVAKMSQSLELLAEQVAILNQRRFGRSSEKHLVDGQMGLFDCFNEIEATVGGRCLSEPEFEEVCPKPYKRKKQKGKRQEDLKDFAVVVVPHELTEEQLREIFGEGWKRLPDEVYRRLEFHPATFEVVEHHVAVYAGADDQTIVRSDRPVDLLRNSIATPSLVAGILNGKYTNALPLYRLEQDFERNGVNISRQVMANWVIQCADRYLALLYDLLHEELLKSPITQADETTVLVSKDGRAAGTKSYMWVYRTGVRSEWHIILYDYQRTRNANHPREFLKGYTGTCVTDGYQVYHSMEGEDLRIAGCWSHARRRFADVVKSLGKEKAKGTLAYQALKQIGAIYKIENDLAGLTAEERQKMRQLSVWPLVEAFFAWVKESHGTVLPKSETGKGFTYCINQEKYLKVFLEDGNVPMDNNGTEQAIRPFCVGRNNWRMIDTVAGAKSSAIVYSIVETAKANGLKVYHYLKHLLTEIPKHMDDKNLSFLTDLLPWSKDLPLECRKKNPDEPNS